MEWSGQLALHDDSGYKHSISRLDELEKSLLVARTQFFRAVGWSSNGEWAKFGDTSYYLLTQNYLHIHADFLWQNFDVIKSGERFPLYYGLAFHFDGGNVMQATFGARGVLGID